MNVYSVHLLFMIVLYVPCAMSMEQSPSSLRRSPTCDNLAELTNNDNLDLLQLSMGLFLKINKTDERLLRFDENVVIKEAIFSADKKYVCFRHKNVTEVWSCQGEQLFISQGLAEKSLDDILRDFKEIKKKKEEKRKLWHKKNDLGSGVFNFKS